MRQYDLCMYVGALIWLADCRPNEVVNSVAYRLYLQNVSSNLIQQLCEKVDVRKVKHCLGHLSLNQTALNSRQLGVVYEFKFLNRPLNSKNKQTAIRSRAKFE